MNGISENVSRRVEASPDGESKKSLDENHIFARNGGNGIDGREERSSMREAVDDIKDTKVVVF